jgi:hypothetical protein
MKVSGQSEEDCNMTGEISITALQALICTQYPGSAIPGDRLRLISPFDDLLRKIFIFIKGTKHAVIHRGGVVRGVKGSVIRELAATL